MTQDLRKPRVLPRLRCPDRSTHRAPRPLVINLAPSSHPAVDPLRSTTPRETTLSDHEKPAAALGNNTNYHAASPTTGHTDPVTTPFAASPIDQHTLR
jgi:hypothetical protein